MPAVVAEPQTAPLRVMPCLVLRWSWKVPLSRMVVEGHDSLGGEGEAWTFVPLEQHKQRPSNGKAWNFCRK